MILNYKDFLNENLSFMENSEKKIYLSWKKKNVLLRGIKNKDTLKNQGSSVLGKGLYTVPLANKSMALQYGNLYYLVGAMPKNPKIFNTLNDWEIFKYGGLLSKWKKDNKIEGDDYWKIMNMFDKHVEVEKVMMDMGYDGVFIKGREIVNYTPSEDIKYFESELELIKYWKENI